MRPEAICQNIAGLISWGSFLVFALFANMLLKKVDLSILGATVPAEKIFLVLGPVLVLVNSTLFVFLAMLYKTDPTLQEINNIQGYQVYVIGGPFFNPFFLHSNQIVNAIGYAFLIILWWVGMHTFLYSINMNTQTPFIFAWQSLISALYLAVGLISMLAIQATWSKIGMSEYKLKWVFGFIGIPIGAFLPPLLLRLGMPKIL